MSYDSQRHAKCKEPKSPSKKNVEVHLYTPSHWHDMWRVRLMQLAEEGVVLDESEIPASPAGADGYDGDLYQVEQTYLHRRGGFWLAYDNGQPCGCVGAQPLDNAIELRRMFVAHDRRRRGIGKALCERLIEHCQRNGFHAIELWTEAGGVGQQLYEAVGFAVVATMGIEFVNVNEATKRKPALGEIRMRLEW